MNTIKEAEDFLNSRKQYGIKPGLDRIQALLEGMNHPENYLQSIHVAGTNGKGSTIAFLSHALIQNGYRTGIFTSPSFYGLKGYFLLDENFIEDDIIVHELNLLLPYIQELDRQGNAPTEYEILTALAFLVFKDRADITLIETAMGGRFDTTNVVHPLLSIITNVEMDHMNFLGNSVSEIAFHKAGIIKNQVPVILGKTKEEAFQVIQQEAEEKKAPLLRFGTDFFLNERVLNWKAVQEKAVTLDPSMQGTHQLINAATAYAALTQMNGHGITLNESKTLHGIHAASLPGRYEAICVHPLIIIDSAHNVAGMKTMLDTMEYDHASADRQLIFAGFKDKQLTEMLQLAEAHFDKMMITTFSHQRAALLDDYDTGTLQVPVEMEKDWSSILDNILKDTSKKTTYYIAGSLHFITIVREYLKKKKC